MQAFLVTAPHLYQVNGKIVCPGESRVMCNKFWGYVLGSEPQKQRQALTSMDVIDVSFNKRAPKKKKN